MLGPLALLLAEGGNPRTLVYDDDGGCFGVASLLDPAQTLTGTAKYFSRDASGALTTNTCTLPLAAEDAPSAAFAVVLGDLETLACEGISTLPEHVSERLGPVSALSFVVPRASTQEVISAEAAYYLYGFGAAAGVAPWTDDATIYSNRSSTPLMARALGVPRAAFREHEPTNDLVSALTSSPSALAHPEAAIGYLTSATAESNRDRVRALAYQQFGQLRGYWPDSTPESVDKRNVREGRYWLWYASRLLVRTLDGVTDPGVERLATLLNTDPSQPVEPAALDAIIAAGQVPRCAMRVWRDGDFGPLYAYAPSAPCGCYFDAKATAEVTCTACEDAADCPNATDLCSYGYCEPGAASAP